MLRLDINLLFTIINLLILYFIVVKFLFKPVKNILAKRQEEIDKQYADAKACEEGARKLKKRYEESMVTAEAEREALVSEARRKAGKEYDKIVSDAKAEADKLIEDARKLAKNEQEKSISQAKEQIADLVVEAVEKIVASEQDEDADKELYNEFLKKAEK